MTPSSAEPGGADAAPDADDLAPDPWHTRRRVVPPHSDRFGELVDVARDLHDVMTATNPPDDVVADAIAGLRRVADALRPYEVDESHAPAGKLDELPGRGQPLLPAFAPDAETDDSVTGHVTFTRSSLGGNGAVHGGAIPLLFDEVLGRLANSAGRPTARTAYLHVDYRRITPVGVPLLLEARVVREEGRKCWVTGRLLHAGELCAEAEGLFVALRPGQP